MPSAHTFRFAAVAFVVGEQVPKGHLCPDPFNSRAWHSCLVP